MQAHFPLFGVPVMSQTATSPSRSPRVPPEDAFYTRYSPHHEMPLSSVTLIAIHVLVIGLLIIGGIVIARLNWGADQGPVAVDARAMEEGGGGGNLKGIGPGPGDGATGDPDAPDAPLTDPNQQYEVSDKPREQLKDVRDHALKLEEFKDEEGQRLIERGGQEVDKILRINSDLRKKLNGAIAGNGQGGPGRRGGKGTGDGPGEGPGTGPGKGGNADRSKRPMRWTLLFNTRDGNDYRNQLQDFGAIIAVPDPKDPNGYLVIRQLSPAPVQARPEDISEIKRIYWFDDKPASVHSLAGALGIAAPPQFAVFFPIEFEMKLLNLELKYRGKQENEINETRFEIRRMGGKYEPVVISQR